MSKKGKKILTIGALSVGGLILLTSAATLMIPKSIGQNIKPTNNLEEFYNVSADEVAGLKQLIAQNPHLSYQRKEELKNNIDQILKGATISQNGQTYTYSPLDINLDKDLSYTTQYQYKVNYNTQLSNKVNVFNLFALPIVKQLLYNVYTNKKDTNNVDDLDTFALKLKTQLANANLDNNLLELLNQDSQNVYVRELRLRILQNNPFDKLLVSLAQEYDSLPDDSNEKLELKKQKQAKNQILINSLVSHWNGYLSNHLNDNVNVLDTINLQNLKTKMTNRYEGINNQKTRDLINDDSKINTTINKVNDVFNQFSTYSYNLKNFVFSIPFLQIKQIRLNVANNPKIKIASDGNFHTNEYLDIPTDLTLSYNPKSQEFEYLQNGVKLFNVALSDASLQSFKGSSKVYDIKDFEKVLPNEVKTSVPNINQNNWKQIQDANLNYINYVETQTYDSKNVKEIVNFDLSKLQELSWSSQQVSSSSNYDVNREFKTKWFLIKIIRSKYTPSLGSKNEDIETYLRRQDKLLSVDYYVITPALLDRLKWNYKRTQDRNDIWTIDTNDDNYNFEQWVNQKASNYTNDFVNISNSFINNKDNNTTFFDKNFLGQDLYQLTNHEHIKQDNTSPRTKETKTIWFVNNVQLLDNIQLSKLAQMSNRFADVLLKTKETIINKTTSNTANIWQNHSDILQNLLDDNYVLTNIALPKDLGDKNINYQIKYEDLNVQKDKNVNDFIGFDLGKNNNNLRDLKLLPRPTSEQELNNFYSLNNTSIQDAINNKVKSLSKTSSLDTAQLKQELERKIANKLSVIVKDGDKLTINNEKVLYIYPVLIPRKLFLDKDIIDNKTINRTLDEQNNNLEKNPTVQYGSWDAVPENVKTWFKLYQDLMRTIFMTSYMTYQSNWERINDVHSTFFTKSIKAGFNVDRYVDFWDQPKGWQNGFAQGYYYDPANYDKWRSELEKQSDYDIFNSLFSVFNNVLDTNKHYWYQDVVNDNSSSWARYLKDAVTTPQVVANYLDNLISILKNFKFISNNTSYTAIKNNLLNQSYLDKPLYSFTWTSNGKGIGYLPYPIYMPVVVSKRYGTNDERSAYWEFDSFGKKLANIYQSKDAYDVEKSLQGDSSHKIVKLKDLFDSDKSFYTVLFNSNRIWSNYSVWQKIIRNKSKMYDQFKEYLKKSYNQNEADKLFDNYFTIVNNFDLSDKQNWNILSNNTQNNTYLKLLNGLLKSKDVKYKDIYTSTDIIKNLYLKDNPTSQISEIQINKENNVLTFKTTNDNTLLPYFDKQVYKQNEVKEDFNNSLNISNTNKQVFGVIINNYDDFLNKLRNKWNERNSFNENSNKTDKSFENIKNNPQQIRAYIQNYLKFIFKVCNLNSIDDVILRFSTDFNSSKTIASESNIYQVKSSLLTVGGYSEKIDKDKQLKEVQKQLEKMHISSDDIVNIKIIRDYSEEIGGDTSNGVGNDGVTVYYYDYEVKYKEKLPSQIFNISDLSLTELLWYFDTYFIQDFRINDDLDADALSIVDDYDNILKIKKDNGIKNNVNLHNEYNYNNFFQIKDDLGNISYVILNTTWKNKDKLQNNNSFSNDNFNINYQKSRSRSSIYALNTENIIRSDANILELIKGIDSVISNTANRSNKQRLYNALNSKLNSSALANRISKITEKNINTYDGKTFEAFLNSKNIFQDGLVKSFFKANLGFNPKNIEKSLTYSIPNTVDTKEYNTKYSNIQPNATRFYDFINHKTYLITNIDKTAKQISYNELKPNRIFLDIDNILSLDDKEQINTYIKNTNTIKDIKQVLTGQVEKFNDILNNVMDKLSFRLSFEIINENKKNIQKLKPTILYEILKAVFESEIQTDSNLVLTTYDKVLNVWYYFFNFFNTQFINQNPEFKQLLWNYVDQDDSKITGVLNDQNIVYKKQELQNLMAKKFFSNVSGYKANAFGSDNLKEYQVKAIANKLQYYYNAQNENLDNYKFNVNTLSFDWNHKLFSNQNNWLTFDDYGFMYLNTNASNNYLTINGYKYQIYDNPDLTYLWNLKNPSNPVRSNELVFLVNDSILTDNPLVIGPNDTPDSQMTIFKHQKVLFKLPLDKIVIDNKIIQFKLKTSNYGEILFSIRDNNDDTYSLFIGDENIKDARNLALQDLSFLENKFSSWNKNPNNQTIKPNQLQDYLIKIKTSKTTENNLIAYDLTSHLEKSNDNIPISNAQTWFNTPLNTTSNLANSVKLKYQEIIWQNTPKPKHLLFKDIQTLDNNDINAYFNKVFNSENNTQNQNNITAFLNNIGLYNAINNRVFDLIKMIFDTNEIKTHNRLAFKNYAPMFDKTKIIPVIDNYLTLLSPLDDPIALITKRNLLEFKQIIPALEYLVSNKAFRDFEFLKNANSQKAISEVIKKAIDDIYYSMNNIFEIENKFSKRYNLDDQNFTTLSGLEQDLAIIKKKVIPQDYQNDYVLKNVVAFNILNTDLINLVKNNQIDYNKEANLITSQNTQITSLLRMFNENINSNVFNYLYTNQEQRYLITNWLNNFFKNLYYTLTNKYLNDKHILNDDKLKDLYELKSALNKVKNYEFEYYPDISENQKFGYGSFIITPNSTWQQYEQYRKQNANGQKSQIEGTLSEVDFSLKNNSGPRVYNPIAHRSFDLSNQELNTSTPYDDINLTNKYTPLNTDFNIAKYNKISKFKYTQNTIVQPIVYSQDLNSLKQSLMNLINTKDNYFILNLLTDPSASQEVKQAIRDAQLILFQMRKYFDDILKTNKNAFKTTRWFRDESITIAQRIQAINQILALNGDTLINKYNSINKSKIQTLIQNDTNISKILSGDYFMINGKYQIALSNYEVISVIPHFNDHNFLYTLFDKLFEKMNEALNTDSTNYDKLSALYTLQNLLISKIFTNTDFYHDGVSLFSLDNPDNNSADKEMSEKTKQILNEQDKHKDNISTGNWIVDLVGNAALDVLSKTNDTSAYEISKSVFSGSVIGGVFSIIDTVNAAKKRQELKDNLEKNINMLNNVIDLIGEKDKIFTKNLSDYLQIPKMQQMVTSLNNQDNVGAYILEFLNRSWFSNPFVKIFLSQEANRNQLYNLVQYDYATMRQMTAKWEWYNLTQSNKIYNSIDVIVQDRQSGIIKTINIDINGNKTTPSNMAFTYNEQKQYGTLPQPNVWRWWGQSAWRTEPQDKQTYLTMTNIYNLLTNNMYSKDDNNITTSKLININTFKSFSPNLDWIINLNKNKDNKLASYLIKFDLLNDSNFNWKNKK